jgi:hypothetical protein
MSAPAGILDRSPFPLEAERRRDQRSAELWKEAAERADPAKVARMMAHVEAQTAQRLTTAVSFTGAAGDVSLDE